jgi:hypothetical protein
MFLLKQNFTQRTGDRLHRLRAYARALICSYHWNRGDERAYVSYPMTPSVPWHDIVTCAKNSKQLVYRPQCGVRRRRKPQVEKRDPRAGVKRRVTAACVAWRFETCVQVAMPATLVSFRCCSPACTQISRARVSGECGCTTARRSGRGGAAVVEGPVCWTWVIQWLYTRLYYSVQFSNLRVTRWKCVIIWRRSWKSELR